MTNILSGSAPLRRMPKSAASSGGIPHRFLMLPVLQHDLGPPSAQQFQHVMAIDALMGDEHQSPMIAPDQSGEANRAPSPKSPCRPVSDIAETAPQPSHSVMQACWRSYRDDSQRRRGRRLSPILNARPPSSN